MFTPSSRAYDVSVPNACGAMARVSDPILPIRVFSWNTTVLSSVGRSSSFNLRLPSYLAAWVPPTATQKYCNIREDRDKEPRPCFRPASHTFLEVKHSPK